METRKEISNIAVIISSCLLGEPCRYDGSTKSDPRVQDFASRHQQAGGVVIPVCPEVLGGLGTPRPAAELKDGDGRQVLRAWCALPFRLRIRHARHLHTTRYRHVSRICTNILCCTSDTPVEFSLRNPIRNTLLAGQARVERCADGKDVTAAFIAGARLAASQGESCGLAILKARSPSCGVGRTTIDGQTAPGDGVFAALLKQQGIPSFSNESSADFFLELTKGTP